MLAIYGGLGQYSILLYEPRTKVYFNKFGIYKYATLKILPILSLGPKTMQKLGKLI